MKPIYLLRSVIIGSSLLLATNTNAQMVGSNVFLQGKYVEVGMTANGSYGADTSPATYHSHICYTCTTPTPSGPLGFVADPAMDGWTVGTPAYVGDYFYPGSPFEGWMLQVDGKRCQAYNSGGFTYSGGMPPVTGSTVSYTTSGSTVSSIWQGMIDSILVTQTTTLDTNALYFLVKINLTNLSVLPKNDIYYFRSTDADNDVTWPTGSFLTNNLIEHQMPGISGTSVVSATGTSSPMAYLAFGTADTASRAVIYNSWGLTVSQDLSALYDGTYGVAYYDEGVNHPGDIAIALVMSIPHLATVDSAGDSVLRTTSTTTLHPANTAKFTYFYAFSHPAIDSAIVHSIDTVVTPPSTLEIKNVNSSSDIKVYPNPSKDIVSITGLSTTDRISMYDMMGRETGQNWKVNTNGANTFRYNNVPAGAYVLIVTDANGNVKTRMPVRKQ